ncbi:MAG: PIN domain-containing protein [Syntrophobacter sp.]
MRVLVDTCIWSMALRHSEISGGQEVSELMELIKELRVQLIGPVRQEILSGIKSHVQFTKLRDHLRPFPDLELTTRDFETAAEFYNTCRGKGVQGSNTDFLICAIAVRNQMAIFTTDVDFTYFQKYLPIKLHRLRIDR